MAVAYAPDGQHLATASADGTVRVWEAGTGKELRRFPGHPVYGFAAVAYAPDGRTLAASGFDGAVHWWDPATGRKVGHFTEKPYSSTMTITPEGKILAAGFKDQTVILRDALREKELRSWPGPARAFHQKALFSPDGRWLAVLSHDLHQEMQRDQDSQLWTAALSVWAVDTGKELAHFQGHRPSFWSFLAFSPDGKMLATEGADQAISFWEVATGKERLRLPR
jgi:WD40 repeat protein